MMIPSQFSFKLSEDDEEITVLDCFVFGYLLRGEEAHCAAINPATGMFFDAPSKAFKAMTPAEVAANDGVIEVVDA